MILELPRWYDLHAHFRQGPIVPGLIEDHLAMGCAGMLAMPNTKPPVAKIKRADDGDCWSIEEYRDQLMQAGADAFDHVLTPLYLTGHTTPAMIEHGARSGLLRSAKYYPPHGTTGADFGQPFQTYIDNGLFQAMADNNVILNIHGEEHGLTGEAYFGRNGNAEETFYRERLPAVLDAIPTLKIVGEHVTTKVAVDTVRAGGPNIAATITPQHLLYTAGDLLQGFKYHLYCLPLIKFGDDRQTLRDAVCEAGQTKFFAGTDSAPHVEKVTPCGCAAGCYTGAIAPQLYAQAFEEAHAEARTPELFETNFNQFLCVNGANFYDLPISNETFRLIKQTQPLKPGKTGIAPLPYGMFGDAAALHWAIDKN